MIIGTYRRNRPTRLFLLHEVQRKITLDLCGERNQGQFSCSANNFVFVVVIINVISLRKFVGFFYNYIHIGKNKMLEWKRCASFSNEKKIVEGGYKNCHRSCAGL